jgi:hypothetical protein
VRRLLRSNSTILVLVTAAIASMGFGSSGALSQWSGEGHRAIQFRSVLPSTPTPSLQQSAAAAVPSLLAQEVYLKASNTKAGYQFGAAIAISGDTLVVGAPGESSNATGVNGDASNTSAPVSGAVYVFVRNGGVWSQQAYLKASNTGTGDSFGYSVALSGDTLVVGAPYEDSSAAGINGNAADNGAFDSGAAYVFVRGAGGWSQEAYLKASNTGSGDRFGYSVSVSGDTVAVGADGEDSAVTGVDGSENDNSAEGAGAAYVFFRSSGSWVQQAYLKASNTGEADAFGWSVGVSGATVIVGAPNEDSASGGINGDGSNNSAESSGAAYVFARSGVDWSQQAYIKGPQPGENDLFGFSVSISADTAVVGAVNEDSGATGVNGNSSDNSAMDSGAAFVFLGAGGFWSQRAYLKASNTGVNDFFGSAVSISGDTIVVGAPYEYSAATGVNGNGSDNSAPDAGAAYQFQLASGGWSQLAYLKASNTGSGDRFGFAVAASSIVAVAAVGERSSAIGINGNQIDNSTFDAGATYAFTEGGQQPLTLSVGGTSIPSGTSGSIPVVFLSQGNERNLSFSLNFDTARLAYISAANGNGLPAAASVVFNSSQVLSGRLGVTVTLPVGQSFSSGPHQLMTLNLSALSTQGASQVSFGDNPVTRSVVRPNGTVIPINQVAFNAGTVTVTPPAIVRNVRVVGASIPPGTNGSISVEIDALGTENALAFSLGFDPTRLTFVSANLGTGLPGASLNLNTTLVASGLLGINFDLPAAQALQSGTQTVVVLVLQASSTAPLGQTSITFGDSPTSRELVDIDEMVLPASYSSGTVTIENGGLEADTSPRPNGNGSVTLIDWVQTGRIAVGLDPISPGSEYQRADCAPRETKGNGQLSLADWVQAGRYGSRLDPVVSTGGPTGPVPFTETSLSPAIGDRVRGAAAAEPRVVSIVLATTLPRTDTSLVEVLLEATGVENAISLAISFDASQWDFIDARPGSDARDATLIFKSTPDGKLAVALAMPPGRSLTPGAQRMIDVTLRKRPGAQQRIPHLHLSDDAQVKAEIVDVMGNALPGRWMLPTRLERLR